MAATAEETAVTIVDRHLANSINAHGRLDADYLTSRASELLVKPNGASHLPAIVVKTLQLHVPFATGHDILQRLPAWKDTWALAIRRAVRWHPYDWRVKDAAKLLLAQL